MSKGSGANEFRLIGGRYRRRKLSFAAGSTARPTPNRVRETLFNWLDPHIEGLTVLDLYAGSGALGLEALSRGAASAVFVERDRRLAASIRENLSTLGCTSAQVLATDAERYLQQSPPPVDVVFLDPPFDARAHSKLCKLLKRQCSINRPGWCYLEFGANEPPVELPTGWDVWRDKTAGNVRYQLVRVTAEPPPDQNGV